MITKREKLQYIYVFLTDLLVLLLSTLLAWLVTDGLLKQLVPYAPSDWVQTICLLMLAYLLSATPLGVIGIWLSVPIGWALADAIGIGYYLKKKQ